MPTAHAEVNDGAESPAQALPRVIISTTEGDMELTLRPDVAPVTVKNFLAYVDSGFYDGTIFHRVIPGFMIQGGGFDDQLRRKATRAAIQNEARPTYKNLRGTIAMARTSNPDSATSQFFINLVDNEFLNAGVRGAGYAVFGRITEGLGVADAIASQQTGYRKGMRDVPVNTVYITRITRAAEQAE
ncbi:peptidylprolyl isomerase [Marinobacter sp. X15-166B]|uniref:peptidylprolyl isomerase n=1 Tax=Marinobacter sp. X15-166B TaxID=1897620 RepID=UPI0009F29E4D|nr:peptidylprolyl isomerase [Marinobacter sp. X15-166B]